MKRLHEVVLIAALVAMSAIPRLAGLGRFTSLDEPFWLRQSGNFYYALGQREFQNTLYEYHPAVTTMWIISAGLLVYFPQYRALGQGYLKPGKFDLFLADHGKTPLELLVVSRLIQVLLVLILLLVVYTLLRSLFGRSQAFVATGFISLAPFLLGQSRLLNHEAMLALFLLISMLAILAYLHSEHRLGFLVISGVAAGLAQLTKSSGMPIIPLIALMLALDAIMLRSSPPGRSLLAAGKAFGLWLVALSAAYVIVWPGMWVAPGAMLSDVYGNALSYMLQGARVSVLPGQGTGGLDLSSAVNGVGIYLNDLLWRTTPLTGAGLLVGLGLVFYELRNKGDARYSWLVLYALLLAAAFVLLFGIQKGPKPPHYLLTSYVALDLIAGLAIWKGWQVLSSRIDALASAAMNGVALGLVLALQLASSVTAFPYYISYYNPVIEAMHPGVQNPTLNETGYGVGLDQAAAYLSRKPDAAKMSVLSAHGLGCFSYYFPGRTIAMNDLILSDPTILGIVRDSQYVVVDYFNQGRHNLVSDFADVAPEKTIWINGRDFLHIYRAADLLDAVAQ